MKPYLHISTFAATLLMACCFSCVSVDEPEADVPEPEPQARMIAYGDEISFDVSASSDTRGGLQPCHFVMSALLKDSSTPAGSFGTLFIDHDVVEDIGVGGEHKWVNNSQTRYWPADKDVSLDFYIHASGFEHSKHGKSSSSPSSIEWKDSQDQFSPSLKVFIASECGDQEDLLYATAFGQRRSADGQAMPLDVDMRRAMTQVLFDACVANDNIHVEVSDITLCGTPYGAYFRFPTPDGDEAEWEIPEHVENVVRVHMPAMVFDETGLAVPFEVGKDVRGISYEVDEEGMHAVQEKEMKLIPGNYKRGRYAAGLWSNMYLMVDCVIWNVAEQGRFHRGSDYVLWGDKDPETGEAVPATLYIPVDWGQAGCDNSRDMGKCYIYTLTFGRGNAAKSSDGRNLSGIADCSLRITDWVE